MTRRPSTNRPVLRMASHGRRLDEGASRDHRSSVAKRGFALVRSRTHLSEGSDVSGRSGGVQPGRESPDERIHFAAIGMGISDVALGSMIYETAVARGLGTTLRLWNEPLWS